jgi:hypothetical protein
MEETGRKESELDAEQGIKERHSEATSKDTLSDLEGHQNISGAKPGELSEENTVPSPDGEADDGRQGRADGSDSSGPI